jgi:mannose-1-phosphate guanylyltransferase
MIPVIILAGGRGTRLPVSAADRPKPMVEVQGRPMVEHHLERLREAGFSDIRFALGHRADQFVAYLNTLPFATSYVIESSPMGTGGAARLAAKEWLGARPAMVLNADTFAHFDFPAIAKSHTPGTSLITAAWKDDARDFGLLDIVETRVEGFREKPTEPTAGYINAGCYILDPMHIEKLPDGPSMLERDLFPVLAREGALAAYIHEGSWDDLGTEERLRRARAAKGATI